LFEISLYSHSKIPMVGASGAIAGLMGGYLKFFPNHRIDVLFALGWYFKIITLPAWTMLIYWFFFQLISGLGALAFFSFSPIAYFVHLGGFLSGFLLVGFLKKK